MSMNLYWEPIAPRKRKGLSDDLKFILREHRALNEGDVIIGRGSISWLQGALAAASSQELRDDIQTLLDALGTYEELRLWQE